MVSVILAFVFGCVVGRLLRPDNEDMSDPRYEAREVARIVLEKYPL